MNDGNLLPRILVVGSINMDIVAQVERHVIPGETITGTSLSYFPGGKGANQAVAAARAGGKVFMIGAVGDDAFGPGLVEFLHSNDIDAGQVILADNESSGTALIVVDASGENSIVYVPGANARVTPKETNGIPPVNGDVLVAQFETPVDTTTSFFAAGKQSGATCILNPAPAGDVPTELLGLVDVLVVNETELGVVSDTKISEVPTVEDIRSAHAALSERGFAGSLVTTLGERGSVTLANGEVIVVPGRKVEAIDTTGAGDCFAGYLASELAGGHELKEALLTANIASSICVQRRGAGPSMPQASEVRTIESEES